MEPLEYKDSLDQREYQVFLDRWVNAVFKAYREHLVRAGREVLRVRLDREVLEAELGLEARRAFKAHLVHEVSREFRVSRVSRAYRVRWARRARLDHQVLPVRRDLSVLQVLVRQPSLYISENRSTGTWSSTSVSRMDSD